MKFLVRFITRNSAGGVESHDRIIDAPVITMGRATDQMLHLQDRRARLQHAQLEEQDGAVRITTAALAGVDINGRSQRDAKLAAGDVVKVGSNILSVIEPPEGVDFAVTFELDADADESAVEYDWQTIGDRPRLRKYAWILVAIVFIVALALPAISALFPGAATVARYSTLLPDDGLWLAGPVHRAHAAISTDCRSCHTALFERVPDDACLACHKVSRHVIGESNTVLGERRCASCHLEHNEPPQLVSEHQGLCADCHKGLPPETGLANASDFLLDHPGFRISLLRPQVNAKGEIAWEEHHLLLADAQGAEQSNLKFDHAAHLDPEGIVTPDGRRVIECTECHQPETGGARMRPIRMDEHCAACHTLSFDANDPNRTVPHGDPAAVMQTLVEYYSARLLGDETDSTGQRVRRPGRALTREDRDRAAAEARVSAMKTTEDLFERRACVNCHEVTRVSGEALPWHVEPVQLTSRFYPHSVFSHKAHESAEAGCASCHNAADSEQASDVLIPGIETCRDCHGSAVQRRNDASQTPSTCIMCHNFHFEAKGSYP
jgi:predicted CXXCH cytochrome family protein